MNNAGYEHSSSDVSSEAEYYDTNSISSNQNVAKRNSTCELKDNFSQTDHFPITTKVYQIQRVSHPDIPFIPGYHSHISLFPDGSQAYVLESLSLGFHKGTQTDDHVIYKKSRVELDEIFTCWRILQVLLPSFLHLIVYFLDQIFDIVVTVEFCRKDDGWLCGLGLFFIVIPSLLISFFAYQLLIHPDVYTICPLDSKRGKILCLLQVSPYYLIGRRLLWGLRAWSFSYDSDKRVREKSRDLWQKASEEDDSTTVKMLQSILESIPQLGLQSFALIKTYKNGEDVIPALWVSSVVNLISASSGIGHYYSNNLFERFAAVFAVLTILGTRVTVCSSMATLHPVLFIVPLLASFVIGFVTKISESTETTFSDRIKKLKNYFAESLIMASVCPPFNPTGIFCSAAYVLSALVFFVEDPESLINILGFVLAIFGQVIWVSIGFCLVQRPRKKVLKENRPA
ncbi:UNVERIFIED_CONTAM: hypothetical protein RMT77_000608 [Armadillidium vulgare]